MMNLVQRFLALGLAKPGAVEPEAPATTEGTAQAVRPFDLATPVTADALLRRTWPPLPDPWRPTTQGVLAYWTTCPPAPRSRWPRGERGPMPPAW